MRAEKIATVCSAIAANVRQLRLARGWTQEQLGEAAEVAARYVQRIETGRINPSAAVVAAIAEALGVDPGRLFRAADTNERPAGRPPKRHR